MDIHRYVYILHTHTLAHKQTLLSEAIMPRLMCHRRESQRLDPQKWGCISLRGSAGAAKYEVHCMLG